jgi:hypothetical protein
LLVVGLAALCIGDAEVARLDEPDGAVEMLEEDKMSKHAETAADTSPAKSKASTGETAAKKEAKAQVKKVMAAASAAAAATPKPAVPNPVKLKPAAAKIEFISTEGAFAVTSSRGFGAVKETSDKGKAKAKLLTPAMVNTIQKNVSPGFGGETTYFTGQSKPGQADGTPFPGSPSVGTAVGSLSYVTNMAPLSIQGKTTWSMIYAADNAAKAAPPAKGAAAKKPPAKKAAAKKAAAKKQPVAKKGAKTKKKKKDEESARLGEVKGKPSYGWHPAGFGKVRTIDPKTGAIGTIAQFDKIDWDEKKARSIFAVAAHSFVVDKTKRTSFVYAAIENNGIFQMDLNTKKMKRIKVPTNATHDDTQSKHFWGKGYRDVCITAPVSADNRRGTSKLFLHYRKKVYAMDASKCLGATDCKFVQLTDFLQHEGFSKSMACAAHKFQKAGAGGKPENQYMLYLSQRSSSRIVSLDLTNSFKVKGATVPQTVIAKSTGASSDGSAPLFIDFQSIAIYAPTWREAHKPYVLLSGGRELRVLDPSAKYAETLAHSKDGAVVALGDACYSGREKIFRTDLRLRVGCGMVKAHVLPEMVKWKIPKDRSYGKEVKKISVNVGPAQMPWVFTALKKTATLRTGVVEKAALCSRQLGTTSTATTSEYCCVLKFSRKVQNGPKWDDQVYETVLF